MAVKRHGQRRGRSAGGEVVVRRSRWYSHSVAQFLFTKWAPKTRTLSFGRTSVMPNMHNQNYDFDDVLDCWDLPVFIQRNPETGVYTTAAPLFYISAFLHFIRTPFQSLWKACFFTFHREKARWSHLLYLN
jgi:hypothetical protein